MSVRTVNNVKSNWVDTSTLATDIEGMSKTVLSTTTVNVNAGELQDGIVNFTHLIECACGAYVGSHT